MEGEEHAHRHTHTHTHLITGGRKERGGKERKEGGEHTHTHTHTHTEEGKNEEGR